MRLTRKFLWSFSIDSNSEGNMPYELYDLDNDPKSFSPSFIRNLRFSLLLFLAIVLVGALAIFAIGIWTLEAEYGNKQISDLISAQLYKVDSYLMIIGGACIVVITLFGILGVWRGYKCLLGLHLGLLAFMSVMLFVAGILAFVLVSELEDKVRDKMEDAVVDRYGFDLEKSSTNRVVTRAWDEVQQNFECCGVYGAENSENSWYIYQRSKWFTEKANNGSYVPDSCCKGKLNLEMCTGRSNQTAGRPPRQKPPVTDDPSTRGYTLYMEGCFDVLDPYMRRTGIIIGTTALVVGIFMLIELVLSICLYRTLPFKI